MKLRIVSALLVALVLLIPVRSIRADASESTSARFGGIYKVSASNDPIFPATATREYFLDFGKGIGFGKLSGSVAVSVRMNPHVNVRILSWQYFPDQGRLVIGRPFAHGSGNAVAAGSWEMTGGPNGVILERGVYQVVLSRADPKDH